MKKIMLGFALAALVGSAFAESKAWFNAGIDKLDDWPEYTIPEPEETGGSWDGTSVATLVAESGTDPQHLNITDASSALEFTAEDSKSLSQFKPTVSSTVKFTAFDLDDKPEIPENAKGGVIVCEDANGGLSYWGVAKPASTNVNGWVQLDGTPSLETTVTISITLNTLNGSEVTYQIGSGEAATYDIVLGDEPVLQKTSYKGIGSVYTLVGTTEPVIKTLTIGSNLAATDNLQIASIENATKVNDTTYNFEAGANLTVYFAPTSGSYIWKNVDCTNHVYAAVNESFTIDARPSDVSVAYAGTDKDPILIYDLADFAKIKGGSYAGVHFKQVNNLDFSETEPWDSSSAKFNGVYDGNNQTIYNITFARTKYNGLFGEFGGAISNLTAEFDGVANGSDAYSVALVGKIKSSSAIFENVTTQGELSGCDYKCAGFAVQGHYGTFRRCTNQVTISGAGDRLAGFVCFSNNENANLYFEDCSNEGNITVTKSFVPAAGDYSYGCGGFVGMCGNNNHHVYFTRCTNTGTIANGVDSVPVGAFVGQAGSNTPKDQTGATTNNDYVVAVGCRAKTECQPIGAISSMAYAKTTVTGLNFATLETVDEVQYANYCTPTTVGTYAVMMSNSDEVSLTGVEKGETLTLNPFKSGITFTGTVTNDNAGLVATQEGNTWTFGLAPHKIIYIYEDEDGNELSDVENSNPTTFTIESGTITFDSNKVSKTGYTFKEFDPESIDCEAATQDVEVTVRFTANGKVFTISATGCTTLKVNDVTVDSPFETGALAKDATIKIDFTYDTTAIKLPVRKYIVSGVTTNDLSGESFTYTVTGAEDPATIDVMVEDASTSEQVTPKDVVPAGTDADKKEAAESNITVLATRSGATDKTLLKSIAGWVGTKGISGNDIAVADADDLEAAYLLNCGDLKDATIEAAKAAFKFPSITPGTKPTVTTPDGYHGTLTTWGNPGLDADDWVDLKDKTDMSPYKFYKAEITK